MPELPEVERFRALAERLSLGRRIAGVDVSDGSYLKRGMLPSTIRTVLIGRSFRAARRRGKLLMLDLSGPGRGGVLGLRFGMTGRLLVDGQAGVGRLLYSAADDARYSRFSVRFEDGGSLAVRDSRRLGGVELDPTEERLGPDALNITATELAAAFRNGAVCVKGRLMDQARVAGVGNLIADEVLWRAGIAPARPAGSLTEVETSKLHETLTTGIVDLLGRGGSHTGDLQPQRRPGGRCPRDGTPLQKATFGGRTTWWCPHHQR
jgi:formamidopyrimidine-DNA glycosylase